ncbi:MAG: helix-turn-helix domain-containing protein [Planctomycetaceae bacterium]|nr:helix-turn-helix domain-containing protein [Planctomycetaceae bacterium]
MKPSNSNEPPLGNANRRLLTIKEAAQVLCCSEANVYALKEAGELPFVCVGVRKGYRIDSFDVEAFIDRKKTNKVAAPVRTPRPRLKHLRLSK